MARFKVEAGQTSGGGNTIDIVIIVFQVVNSKGEKQLITGAASGSGHGETSSREFQPFYLTIFISVH